MHVIELLVLATVGGLWLHFVIRDLNPPELRLPRWFLTRSELAFRQWRLDLWNDAAVSCGLRVMDISRQTAPRLKIETRAGPVTVRIEEPLNKKSGLRIAAVFPAPPGFPKVRIRRKESRPPGARELETGDERFDSAFSIEGPAQLLSALLDAEMRRLLASAKAGNRLEISRGEVRVETSEEELEEALPLLLEISRRLAQDIGPAQRLTENARQDPEPGVRLRNLRLLAGEFPNDRGTFETLRAACSDASPQIRLLAAVELGARGRDVLAELAEGLEDDACSAEAVTRLGLKLPVERTRVLLPQALRRRRFQTARACLKALSRSEDPETVDLLVKVLTAARDNLAIAAAAARALGETGSLAAVRPLQDAAERSPDAPELLHAIRQALAEIKARQPGISPGQISLATAETGQLSLTPEPGQLSFPPAEAGRLSLTPAEDDRLPLPPKEPERHGT